MTGPEGAKPIADCFLYATHGGEPDTDPGPPPLDAKYASAFQVALPVTEDDVEILWSPTGEAVAVRVRGDIVGFITSRDLRGYSRSVNQDCPWAHAFDAELYRRVFNKD